MTHKKQGLSLIELIVTLFILTIGIAALVKFQSRYFYYYDIGKQRAEALVIAKNKMEIFKTFDVITTTTGKVAYNDIVSGTASTAGTNATYTNTWTVTTNTNPDYKVVGMVVTWNDRRGAAQSLTLTGDIAKTDPATSGLIYS